MKQYIVGESWIGVRIDKYLSEQDSQFSRSRIQTMLQNGAILVNEETVKANYRVKEGDIINIADVTSEPLTLTPVDMNLDIVYEDADIIVINKERGLVVHPGAGNYDYTLVHGLLAHCKDLSGINGVYRPGIVHRIDKDTTGLLVVAKNDEAHEKLSKQLKDKTMNRTYQCLVHGVIEHDYGSIDAPIGRDEKDRLKMAVTSKNSKAAMTHFKVLERFKNYTFLECELDTGRTHQIRVHMKYIQHPIVGDPKYAGKNEFQIEGQLLHAIRLTLIHPTNHEKMVFEAPRPAYFDEIIEELRRS